MILIRRISWLSVAFLLVISLASCKQDSTGTTNTKVKNNLDSTSQQNGSSTTGKQESAGQKRENVEAITLTIIGDNKKGTIVETVKVPIAENDSLLDATLGYLKQKGIQYSVRGSGSTAYVEGIDNIYEFDHGPMSGWEAKKNGHSLSKSAGITSVKDGDTIRWVYTTNYKEGD